ncbi:hypothetical protein M378DRAFT_197907 [Amanita muscaria Koide BX008]|uniref:SPX domain-containing protein n=1 Tax=Amanita muscaria (strain Koide BX008) TaxID=946122 RepID=A0A0C2SR89_AMAMK|nr:hypothetical protein M378DRAFT_197907 [Amanita muscaria Koide BX008]
MKFSSSLKFNAVADWWDDYIAYDTLKRRIYQLEKQLYAQPRGRATTSAAYRDDIETGARESLLQHQESDALFLPLLDRELAKICNFYKTQEKEILQEFGEIDRYVQELEERGVHGYGTYYDEDEDDDDDDESITLPDSSPIGRRRRPLSESSFRNPQPQQKQPATTTIIAVTREGGDRSPTTQPASPTDSASTPHARFTVPSLSPAHQSRLHTFPRRTRTRSRSVGALGAFTTTLQNLKDSFTSGGTHDGLRDGTDGDGGAAEISIWTSSSNYAYDTRLLLKRRMTTLYISLTNLRSYVELNYTGFRKILKKYDKVVHSDLSGSYLDKIRQSYPFKEETKECLESTVDRLIDLYSKCVTLGEADQARTQLKAHQREQIAWERDTVWRLMIGRERRGEVANITGLTGVVEEVTSDGLGSETMGGGASLVTVRELEPALFRITLPGTRTKEGKRKAFRVTKRMFWFVLAMTCLVWLSKRKVIHHKGEDTRPANACLAVLVFCTILWASEAIPLFVTSLSVPFLLVVLRAIRDDEGKRLSAGDATKFIFAVIFSPTIMLLIGGFTISSALSKTNIDKLIITRVLHMAGTKPTRVILAFMGVSCFASMWISNVAAPTLCFTLIRPILRTLPRNSSFAPCLILAIALAANIGGQSSPISSPQNLIAIDYLDKMEPPLDWARWFAVSLPVSSVSIILIWLLLIVSYRPSRLPPSVGGDIFDEDPWDGSVRELEIKPIRPTKETFTAKQYWVSCVCLVTIALWCVAHEIEDYLGDMGIIAIMPIVAFFGTGVLKKDDFEHFAWSIVFLAMGGIALGKGVVASGLLEVMDVVIRDMLHDFSLYTVVLILAPVVLVVSTFISHTIASVLLVPIAKEVGKKLPGGHHSNLLIFITALICSAGMGMPVSGFPNQTAAAQEDELGQPYLTNVDFLKNGVPASIIATLVVVTIGFVFMKLIGL